jgi:hypothetical protein
VLTLQCESCAGVSHAGGTVSEFRTSRLNKILVLYTTTDYSKQSESGSSNLGNRVSTRIDKLCHVLNKEEC